MIIKGNKRIECFTISKYIILITFVLFFSGCNDNQKENIKTNSDTSIISSAETKKSDSIKTKKEVSNNNNIINNKGIISKLPTDEKVIAFTFDGCETRTPAYLDEGILSYLTEEKIPFTIFTSGKFAKRNNERLKEISKLDFAEIENHSMNHFQNMKRLPDEKVKNEVLENEKIISDITGKKTQFFRFPAGNYNQRVLDDVESLGYKVVHWRVPSGDPIKRISVKRLAGWVLYNAKPGDILIFHINGRGYKTSAALPLIIEHLRNEGYRFVRLEDYIK